MMSRLSVRHAVFAVLGTAALCVAAACSSSNQGTPVAPINPNQLIVAKSFNPNTAVQGTTVLLTITITNPNAVPVSGVSISDTLPSSPAPMVVTSPNPTISGCGAGNFAPADSDTTISMGNTTTATIAANSSCTFSVQVSAGSAGSYLNTTGDVQSTQFGTGPNANATMTYTAVAPAVSKTFGPSFFAGGTTSLTFTISNSNSFSDTGVAVSDTFPTGMTVAASPNPTQSGCGSATWSPTAASASVSFSGGTVANGTNCVFTVNITANGSDTTYNNTSGNVTSTNAGTGNTASASITTETTPANIGRRPEARRR